MPTTVGMKARTYAEIPRIAQSDEHKYEVLKTVPLGNGVDEALSKLSIDVFAQVAAVRESSGDEGAELILYKDLNA